MSFAKPTCGICIEEIATTSIGGVPLCPRCEKKALRIGKDASHSPRRSPLTRMPKQVAS